jgi:hypothetical protein
MVACRRALLGRRPNLWHGDSRCRQKSPLTESTGRITSDGRPFRPIMRTQPLLAPACSASIRISLGNSGSIARDSAGSRLSTMLPARDRNASAPRSNWRASETTACLASVSFGHIPERSNSWSCSVFSSAGMPWLRADCTRLSCRDAAGIAERRTSQRPAF